MSSRHDRNDAYMNSNKSCLPKTYTTPVYIPKLIPHPWMKSYKSMVAKGGEGLVFIRKRFPNYRTVTL